MDKKDCYVERHHIIPKSEGGTDESDNLVNLTAREHYIAHLLLAKIYNDYKMIAAVLCMRRASVYHTRSHKFNSRLFEKMRHEFAGRVSKMFKGRPSPMKGKKCSEESNLRKSISHMGIPSPNKGKKLSEETKRKIALASRKRKHSEETKRKIAMAITGKRRKGKPFTDEHKRKISERLKGHKSAVLGKKKYTNGIKNIYAFDCPEGYYSVGVKRNG